MLKLCGYMNSLIIILFLMQCFELFIIRNKDCRNHFAKNCKLLLFIHLFNIMIFISGIQQSSQFQEQRALALALNYREKSEVFYIIKD